jgi:hypothetical protein
MHELVYYSIFAIILYFVLSSVFETFSVEQENFDPSLVPVSSIVTLAKVAQKLVNGNGTLTNPGNLQIGATGTTPGGNLTVTGNSTVNGNVLFGGPGSDGFTWVKETSNYACLRAPGSLPNAGAGNRLCFSKDHGIVNFNSDGSLGLAGALNVPGNATIGNQLIVSNQSWGIRTADGKVRNHYDANGRTFYGSGDGTHEWRVRADAAITAMTLSNDSNLNVVGNINARTSGFNTRIGGIWTAPGIYAEDAKNLEIGAGSGNIYVGAVNGAANQNLIVTGNSTVNGNIFLNSTTKAITIGDNNQRIQFHGGDGLKINTYNGGTLAVNKGDPAKYAEGTNIFIWNEGGAAVNGVLSSSGNINARTDGFNTRIGGIWTAPGIYAEDAKNLEIGSGSGNVYIGSVSGVKNNLIVQGNINVAGQNGIWSSGAIRDDGSGYPIGWRPLSNGIWELTGYRIGDGNGNQTSAGYARSTLWMKNGTPQWTSAQCQPWGCRQSFFISSHNGNLYLNREDPGFTYVFKIIRLG